MRFASVAGSASVFLPLCATLALFGREHLGEAAQRCLAGEACMLPVIVALRRLFRRARPSPRKPRAWAAWDLYSFPSHHAARAWMAAATAAACIDGAALPAYFLAVLVGISRVYLLRHHFTDVLAGAALGLAAASVVAAAFMRVLG
ncbi:hypothetical protein NNJEOMEG_00154 [Fundidesulfovibrio magnetotacticus]|uniref:Phosphatidic acid phosphatase type 2/haloperoxidase domain-containing protein n=1 Tax=Fundidesulfovibrio magnetotacticus TaxID=2730080 RepID=A0A6V8LMU7_9BACT|nr:phosphatase PAP2 family protein [Fundidesulfovibrio magnetotacticus]GFK92330.1 hypothetical protein NNJEOMEG_00154 [Fundidesulfovibrio magnetotacticus]